MKNFIRTIEEIGFKVVSISCEDKKHPVISFDFKKFENLGKPFLLNFQDKLPQSLAGTFFDLVTSLTADRIVITEILIMRSSCIVVVKLEKL